MERIHIVLCTAGAFVGNPRLPCFVRGSFAASSAGCLLRARAKDVVRRVQYPVLITAESSRGRCAVADHCEEQISPAARIDGNWSRLTPPTTGLFDMPAVKQQLLAPGSRDGHVTLVAPLSTAVRQALLLGLGVRTAGFEKQYFSGAGRACRRWIATSSQIYRSFSHALLLVVDTS
jgi:hypothetical protein